jgi:hypothetical protein
MRQLIVGAISALLISACASTPRVVVNSKVPAGSTIGIISFRDCLMPQRTYDCPGSGNVAGPVYARALVSKGTLTITPLARPLPATQELPDDAAVQLGRDNNVDFVLNAEVNDYYSLGPITFREDLNDTLPKPSNRVSVSVRLLRVSDGTVAAFQTETVQGAHFETPADVIHRVAERLRDAI